jgi:hypothetical protein
LTEEWGRVLTPHGSICVELGDTYSGAGGYGDPDAPNPAYGNGERFRERWEGRTTKRFKKKDDGWPEAKSLTLIPQLYAASLAYGRNLLNPDHTFEPWRVRNLIAWVRPNPPVGALGDKVRPATSYLTWATRARDRWFDLDAVRQTPVTNLPDANGNNTKGSDEASFRFEKRVNSNPAGAPPLDWWCIPPGGYTGSHYAVYPAELCRIPIEASCPRRVCLTCGKPSRRETVTTNAVGRRPDVSPRSGKAGLDTDAMGIRYDLNGAPDVAERETVGWTTCGCPGTDGIRLDGYHTGTGWRPGHVLDPFGGSGTTAVVATGRGRDCTLVDLDARNADLARERLGMFLDVVRVELPGGHPGMGFASWI